MVASDPPLWPEPPADESLCARPRDDAPPAINAAVPVAMLRELVDSLDWPQNPRPALAGPPVARLVQR